MFGYVRAYKPEMTFSQYDIYKGIYCSLCKQIGRRYGLAARMFLSYDFTFFALLRMAMEKNCAKFHKSRCSFNPLKKCLGCDKNSEAVCLSADISMLTVYYKYCDNIADSKGFKKFLYRLLSPYFKRLRKKAAANRPEADEILCRMNKAQSEAEKNQASLDEAAHSSAKALGELLTLFIENDEKEKIYRLGYMTGRWVYIADAADDYDDDKKSGNFNPLIKYDREDAMKRTAEALHFTLSELTKSFDSLELNCLKSVAANIIYEGMYHTISKITTKEGKNNGKSL